MSAQIIGKCLPVMPVSVKDMLRILKQFKNKKLKSHFLTNFHETFETRPILLYNLHSNFMANDRSHKVT